MEHEGSWARKPFSRLETASVMASSRDRVLRTVREDICWSRLVPGQRLDVNLVVGRTGVSRSVVRQALRDLCEQGWLTTVDEGCVVCVPSPEEAAEIDEVRRALEEVTVRRFVAHASDSQLRALYGALMEFEDLAELPPDPSALLHARDNFYGLLLRAAGVMVTLDALAKLRARIVVLMCASLCSPGRARAAGAELRSIYEALADRDAERAVLACATHVDRSYAAGFRALAALGGPESGTALD
ncbi:GntR family transcriptional regulator [Streptomyces sp. NBC_00582]|uniref:GntR family transcriptional regulator n=1 Tax=Streptomyces sp. NBC_00582 TaxID=2975783 RepID=UPI002E8139FD|nr:GntR family transcriptional regulator [Streptomyces sp. NBC_00582]WUB59560.1 GntR family transcriptional regulator [Streptomyces sp. NBC_00582]